MANGTTLGNAYVQIVPSAKGISGSIKNALAPEASSAGTSSGEGLGKSLVGALKGVVAAAGIGTAIKSSLDAGGAIQQSFGGLDTLYEKASGAAKAYAQDAYKAGISANDYAEQAVSFGASLKAAFEGDTKKAAEAANTAIMDMTDNAAKMGTPLENIQNAYQGFAKQNYTMLDNLKLGYGGTKKEMERLLADAEKLTGKKYDIENLGDVYDAIHAIQEDLGLTGVAAAEAEGTFTGSFGAMKAAAENLLASLSASEMDVAPQMSALVSTASSFFFGNFLPMIGRIAASIPEAVGTLITTAGPIISEKANGLIQNILTFFRGDGLSQMASAGMDMISGFLESFNYMAPAYLQEGADIIQAIVGGVIEALPALTEQAFTIANDFIAGFVDNIPWFMQTGYDLISSLIEGALQAAPGIISSAFSAATTFVTGIMQNLPAILSMGGNMLLNLMNGIIQHLPQILSAAAQGVARFVAGVAQNLPQVLSAGIQLLGKLAAGVINAIPQLFSAAGQAVSQARSAFSNFNWSSIGSNIVHGIASGVAGAAGALFSSLKNLASSALSAAKNALDIHSPSGLFEREVGKYIPEGAALGVKKNASVFTDAIRDLTDVDTGGMSARLSGITSGSSASRASNYYQDTIIALLTIIAEKEFSIGSRDFRRYLMDEGVAFA